MMRGLFILPAQAQKEANEELYEAAKSGDVLGVKVALRKGARVNNRSGGGLTALHFAAVQNHADVAAALVAAGAETGLLTKDDVQATPAMLAKACGNQEVLDVLADSIWLVNPLRKRLLGPAIVTLTVVLNTLLAFLLTDPRLRWHGWTEATGDLFGGPTTHRQFYLPISIVVLLLLLLVHTKNPGYVRPEEVAYANDIWDEQAYPGRHIVDLFDDNRFGVVWPSGTTETFAWCRTCKFWKPDNVAHCSLCRRCCWRFDHHCSVLGTCIGAGNHAAFALLVVVGSLAWTFGVVTVGANLYYHGGLEALGNYKEASVADWPLYLYILVGSVGAFFSVVLFMFGTFHTLTLFMNFNTKMVWKGKDRASWCQLNSAKVLEQIFCAPCEFRACGAPEAFPLRGSSQKKSNTNDDAGRRGRSGGRSSGDGVVSLRELLVPSWGQLDRQISSTGSDTESDSEIASMV